MDRHGICRSVDHKPSPPLHRRSRQPASELVYRLDKRVSVADHAAVQAINEVVSEAVRDIAGTAEGAIGEIFEVGVDRVGAICRFLGILSCCLTVVIAVA